MNKNTETTAKTDAQQEFREMTERGTTQAKETYEKMNAAASEAADFIKNHSTAVKGVRKRRQ